MAITVTMPQLGETVTEGTILSWAKKPGDTVKEDEVLLEISTDKVDTEVPSPAAGVLREILVAEGETVGVGTPLAVIADPSEAAGSAPAAPSAMPQAEPVATAPSEAPAVPAAPPIEEPAAPIAAPVQAAAPSAAPQPPAFTAPEPTEDAPRRANLSPVVRRLADEHGIDLSVVPGTGEGGRISRKDVQAFIDAGGAAAVVAAAAPSPAPAPAPAPAPEMQTKVTFEPAAPAPVAPPVQPAPVPAAAAPFQPAPPPPAAPVPPAPQMPAQQPAAPSPAPVAPVQPAAAAPGDQVVEIGRLRRRIAENMISSKQTAAHVWASVEVDFERVERVRQANKDAFKQQEGFSLTYLPFIARATMDALSVYPVVNSSFFLDEGKQVFHSQVNLGIAVDMNQEGLVVVTVKGADGLRLKGLAREIRGKAMKARDGKLEPDDISSSTFTITNPGPYGSFMTAPIINVPNVAILSTDTVTKRATVVTLPDGSDTIAIHHIGYLSLTWDHRAFDGSTAVLFLDHIRQNLQNWDWDQELH